MKQQIRHSVFETNSSSSHSLTCVQDNLVAVPFRPEVLRAGVLEVPLGDYGWEWRRYYLPEHKLSYLLTQLTSQSLSDGNIPEGNAESVTAQLCEEHAALEQMRQVVLDHTGVQLQFVPGSSGYIDQDSEGVGKELFNSDETLRDFLFSPGSYVETSNDNSCPPFYIETDREGEDYYAASYRTTVADAVTLTLKFRYKWELRVETVGGVELSETVNSALYNELRETGAVCRADWTCFGRFGPFDYDDPRGRTASILSKDEGFFFIPELAVTCRKESVKSEDYFAEGASVFKVPAHLAQAILALDASTEPRS
jgi:hypothetical protein